MKTRFLTILLSMALIIPAGTVHLAQKTVRADADEAAVIETVRSGESCIDAGEDTQISIDKTNFPDDEFRSYILDSIDTEEPKNVLTADEIAKVKTIRFSMRVITSLKGIEYFRELKNLYITDSYLLEVDLSNDTRLEEISFAQCHAMTSLDVSGCSSLKLLDCTDCNSLNSLDVTGCTSLQYFSFSNCEMLTKLDVSSCASLLTLNVCRCFRLAGLDVSSCPALENLYCEGCNRLATLNVTGCSELRFIDVDDCSSLTSLDISTCASLVNLDADYCSIDNLVLGSHPELVQLSCTENDITALDLSNCPKLERLWCEENNISVLKINRNPLLKTLCCEGNPVSRIEIYSSPCLLKLIETDLNPVTGEYTHHLGYKVEYISYQADVKMDGFSYKCRMDIDASDELVIVAPVYSVSVTTDGHGAASASVTSGPEYTEGTLSAVADEGYVFKLWQVISGNVVIGDPASATTAFAIGDSDVEIKAIFEAAPPATPEPGPGPVDPGDPSNPGDPQPGKEPSFEDFVERLYVVALGRASEPEGKAFWVEQVVKNGFTGADCARFFMLGAPEFLGRNLTDDEFVEVLYKTYFDRDSEPDGKAYWMGRLASGENRAVLVEEFIESVEWCNVCAGYGVKSGAQYHKATVPSKNAVKFATRLYTCCLGRDPEEEGLQYWTLALTNLEYSGYEAAKGFFESDEFVGKNVDDTTYVKLLYRTFMGRDFDQSGLEFWLGHLSTDMNRLQVLQGFAQSQEFTNICNEYGIDRGTI